MQDTLANIYIYWFIIASALERPCFDAPSCCRILGHCWGQPIYLLTLQVAYLSNNKNQYCGEFA